MNEYYQRNQIENEIKRVTSMLEKVHVDELCLKVNLRNLYTQLENIDKGDALIVKE